MKTKKLLALLLSAMLCISLAGCNKTTVKNTVSETEIAETNTVENQAADEIKTAGNQQIEEDNEPVNGMLNAVPNVGDTIFGFTVLKEQSLDMLNARVVTLIHNKSGGQVMWIANDDTNRSFTIGFRTHYDTDSGVPHVFEHAVLDGSKKYPDSGLFFNIISQTYQTYVNATTSPIWTDFKAASLSDKQLLKIADFLLDGVFEPLVLTEKYAVMREAYRYEMNDLDDDISLTGTVYSEMKNDYYADAKYYTLNKQLFPGSYYSTCSGGKPGVIETITHKELIDYHKTYYLPSNGLSLLYGDLNLSEFLELIGSYYDNFTDEKVSVEDSNYVPFTGYERVDCDIPASKSEDGETDLFYGMPIRGTNDIDRYMLSQFLGYALDNYSSAMYKEMLEAFPDSSFSVYIRDYAEPMLVFELDNAEGIVPEDFMAAVKKSVDAVMEEGIKYDVLKSSLKSLRVSLITAREGSNIGIGWSESLLSSFARTKDAGMHLNNIDELINNGDAWLDSGILETVITEQVIDPENSRLIVCTKKPGTLEEINEGFTQKLTDMKASMSQEEKQALVDATAEFNTWVEKSDDVPMINEIKALTVEELPTEIKEYTASEKTVNGTKYVVSDTENDKLVELQLYFDASCVPSEDLTRLSTMAQFLGGLSTDRHSHDEIIRLLSEYGISITLTTIGPNDDLNEFKPYLLVDIECLKEDLNNALDAAFEILNDTKFDEKDLIQYYANDTAYSARMYWSTGSPHNLAVYYARAEEFAVYRYLYETNLTPCYKYQERLSDMNDADFSIETDAWEKILTTILSRDNVTVGIEYAKNDIDGVISAVSSHISDLDLCEHETYDYSDLELLSGNTAIYIPSASNNNLVYAPLGDTGVEYSSRLKVSSSILYDKVLIPVMRVRNGVYSPMSAIGRNEAYVLAYSDPSIATTYDKVMPTLGEEIRNMTLTQEELDNYIISEYSELALPLGPISGAKTAVEDVLGNNHSFEDKKTDMENLRTMTVEDIKEAAKIYETLNSTGIFITAGNEEDINKEKERFDTIETWYTSGM